MTKALQINYKLKKEPADMKKEQYENLELEVIAFKEQDIIESSNPTTLARN